MPESSKLVNPASPQFDFSNSSASRSSLREEVQERGQGCKRGARALHQPPQRCWSKDVSREIVSLHVVRDLDVTDDPGLSSNHAVHVTQQNTMVTFSVAATLSRVADAEWIRTCECIRRISPSIGSLGEWRSLCEGAWTGPLPDDLPDMSSETFPAHPAITQAVSEWGQTGLSTPSRRMLPIPPSHSLGSASAPAATSLDPPRSPFSTSNQNQGSINSITTLSAFPFPPTHFPVPLAMNEAELQRQQIQLQSLQSAHSRAGSPNPTQSNGTLAPPAPILSDSPRQMAVVDLPESHVLDASKSSQYQVLQIPSSSPPVSRTPDAPPRSEPLTAEDKGTIKPIGLGGDPKKPRRLSLITRVPPPSDKPNRPVSPFKRAEYFSTEKEFGVHADSSRRALRSNSVDAAKKSVERADSTRSTGGNVAALRHRYTQTVSCCLPYLSLYLLTFSFDQG